MAGVLLLKSILAAPNAMTYAIVIVLSVIFTFLGFAIEITNGNIGHVKNGREPNAGAAIFPNIPFIPLTVLLFAWLLNGCYPNLGFWIVVGLFTLYLPYWWRSLRRLNGELQSLLAESEKRPETAETNGAQQIDN